MDLDEYGDPEEKKNPVFWESVRNVSAESIPPELDDLTRLHFMVISRKITTVMEFGVGKSTIVLADAIKYNKIIHESYVAKNLRRSNPFEVHSVDNNKEWIDLSKKNIPEELDKYINIHLCESEISYFNGRMCSYYINIPNICPDLIYLGGPDQFSSKGNLRGLSTNYPDRMPMAADILSIEHFLTPGTLIIVDGRTANARFLKSNFQRDWAYSHSPDYDQHYFELLEAPLGIYNKNQIDYCLGDDYYKRIKEYSELRRK